MRPSCQQNENTKPNLCYVQNHVMLESISHLQKKVYICSFPVFQDFSLRQVEFKDIRESLIFKNEQDKELLGQNNFLSKQVN